MDTLCKGGIITWIASQLLLNLNPLEYGLAGVSLDMETGDWFSSRLQQHCSLLKFNMHTNIIYLKITLFGYLSIKLACIANPLNRFGLDIL